MKLNKMKISSLTKAQAKAIQGGYTDSTKHNFTCGWCTSNDNTYQSNCETKNNGQNTCFHCAPR